MKYFNQILGGNIPRSVIESIRGIQYNQRLTEQFSHYQIREQMDGTMLPIDTNEILNSEYGETVKASLNLDREKVLNGIKNLIALSSADAVLRNKSDIAKIGKLSSNVAGEGEKEVFVQIIGNVHQDMAASLRNLVTRLYLKPEYKIVFSDVLVLTGITNASYRETKDTQNKMSLLLELQSGFTIEKRVDILQLLANQITPTNIKNCKEVTPDCVVDTTFITRVSEQTLDSIENILEKMLKVSRQDQMCNVYAFSVDLASAFSAVRSERFGNTPTAEQRARAEQEQRVRAEQEQRRNESFGNAQAEQERARSEQEKTPCATCPSGKGKENFKNTKKNKRVIEKFGLNFGSKKKVENNTRVKDLKTFEEGIDQSKVVKGVASMLSSAVNKAVSNNTADLLRSIAASNKIQIGSVKGSSFTLANIKQQNVISQETRGDFAQKVANKVVNDISNVMNDQIKGAASNNRDKVKKSMEDSAKGTNVGDVLNSAMGAVASILDVGVGSSSSTKTNTDITNELKDIFKLDQSFKYEKNNDVKNQLENILSTENLAKCAADTKAANEINLDAIDVTGPVEINAIEQSNVVNDVMSCAFNQEVMNEIANKIINEYTTMIDQLMENVDKSLSDDQKKQVEGDIYATGVAGAAVLGEVGGAAEGLGKGIESAGKGVASAASGILLSMALPLFMILLIAGLGFYFKDKLMSIF